MRQAQNCDDVKPVKGNHNPPALYNCIFNGNTDINKGFKKKL